MSVQKLMLIPDAVFSARTWSTFCGKKNTRYDQYTKHLLLFLFAKTFTPETLRFNKVIQRDGPKEMTLRNVFQPVRVK